MILQPFTIDRVVEQISTGTRSRYDVIRSLQRTQRITLLEARAIVDEALEQRNAATIKKIREDT